MKQIIIGILVLLTVSMADPTHYIDGKWYSCDQSDYDSKGNRIHEKSSDGYESWYKYFGSKKTGQLLQCWVTKDGDPIY